MPDHAFCTSQFQEDYDNAYGLGVMQSGMMLFYLQS